VPRAEAIFCAACGFSVIIRIVFVSGRVIFSGGTLGCFVFFLCIFFLGSSRRDAGEGFPGDSTVVNSDMLGLCFTSFSTVCFTSFIVRKSSTAIFV